jgi:signal transduction histidine kinase
MARQVAHEIKNPLTPIRLGVQHLRRAFRDGRGDFGAILDTNVSRVLAEIDHLDEIARAFSRYGSGPADRAPAEPVDVLHVVRDVLSLERMGESAVTWTLDTTTESVPHVYAGRDELREVLLNLLENARLAGSTAVSVSVAVDADGVSIRVRDNGSGIAPEILPQVFQPHFSTRTSGSGLGLAISRRLVEGWGGTIALSNGAERGTVVHIRLRAVE